MIAKSFVILFAVLAASATEDAFRPKRSLQPGAPNVNNNGQPWQLDPHISRDDKGNVRTDVNIKHHGENHDLDAGWAKVVRGPNRAKPTWHVGGTYRWRRSLQPGAPNINNKDQPWQLDPHISRDDRGNTNTDVNIKHHGENHDFDAGWSKVIRGPNKAKPTWHVGGTYRWRRSLPEEENTVINEELNDSNAEEEIIPRKKRSAEDSDEDEDEDKEPWQFNPSLGRGDDGNTRADINLKRHGDDHDFEASWSKVVDGPGRAKPTWHIGGTYRWRRSLQPGAPNVNNKDQPWQLDPHIYRDDKGNTNTNVNIKHHGDNHDFDAGWSKVVRGPNKAKPTWHVGGTYRWRRSLPEEQDILANEELKENNAEEEVIPRTKRSAEDSDEDEDEDKEPWQFNPSLGRGDDGNTRADINLKRHGDDHDFEASWSKVVDGPGRAKPTWHIGGTYRWRRSLQPGAPNINNKDQPWQLDPHISRDDRGNTNTDVNIKHRGENHDFDAGWSKVIRGPNKAKPTWHVGGTYRWRRSLPEEENNLIDEELNGSNAEEEIIPRKKRSAEDSDEDEDEDKEPWKFNPSLGRGDDGNTRADINLKRHGDDHDFEASWSKVVDGPGRAKPTWHIGGTYRW